MAGRSASTTASERPWALLPLSPTRVLAHGARHDAHPEQALSPDDLGALSPLNEEPEPFENWCLPDQMEARLAELADYYNTRRYHKRLLNLIPADVYRGRGQSVLKWEIPSDERLSHQGGGCTVWRQDHHKPRCNRFSLKPFANCPKGYEDMPPATIPEHDSVRKTMIQEEIPRPRL